MADVDNKNMETKNVQDLTLVVSKLLTDMVRMNVKCAVNFEFTGFIKTMKTYCCHKNSFQKIQPAHSMII